MAYIIDSYNRFDQWDRTHSVYIFNINDAPYAVKEIEMCWGLPMLRYRIDGKELPESYYIYETQEEALEFVKRLKSLNRR